MMIDCLEEFYSFMLLSYSISTSALGDLDLLLSRFVITVALHNTIILIITPKSTPKSTGTSNRKTHVILNYPPKNDNLLIKEEVRTETDKLSHLYTLHVKQDNTFEVLIDQESARTGTLEEAFDFLEAKEIKYVIVSCQLSEDIIDILMFGGLLLYTVVAPGSPSLLPSCSIIT